jgi:hypothetical protein
MALKREVAKELKILDDSGASAVDLSSSQYRAVSATGSVSSGKHTVSLPSGQGVITMGILLNAPASTGDIAQVRRIGIAKAEANATFDAGVELTPAGATGKLEAASSGDYVIGISREAAAEAGHLVSVLVLPPYQKN